MWRLQAKCRNLSLEQNDSLFFPGPGGKVNKADKFCSDERNRCPVLKECLMFAILNDLDGFYAGTTKDDRRSMAPFMGLTPIVSLPEDQPRKRKVFRKVVVTEDTHAWLDKVEGPAVEDLATYPLAN